MKSEIFKTKPFQTLRLDPNFLPMFLANQAFLKHVKKSKQYEEISIAIRRHLNQVSRFNTYVFKEGIGFDEDNLIYLSRLIKSLLWVIGGYEIDISCSAYLFKRIKHAFSDKGKYAFDIKFMSKIYEKPFTVNHKELLDMPIQNESSKPLGRHLNGYRIGFDAGGSDRKVSAVIDGKAIFSEEVIWHPKLNSDPQYHYDGIMDSIQRAASKLPRVDAIGVSSAGIYIDNKIMAASLFLQVDEKVFNEKS
jgi:hypothetical protein